MKDVIILGCGVIGAACAYALSKYDVSVTVLEKSNDVANGTTKANSAIVHAGYDPHPGTEMARLNVDGNRMMEDLCRRLDVPFKRVGSHVLAFSDKDLEHIRQLYDRGVKNGVPGLRLLTKDEVRAMEPNLSENVVGSLYAPTAGIISPWELALAMAQVAVRNGVELVLEAPATAIRREEDGTFTVSTPKGEFHAKTVLNATGTYADAVCDLLGVREFTLTPNRGEYYLLDKSEGTRVHSVIFQCPNENGKGVLVSPTIHGNLIVGPNAEAVNAPDDTANTAEGLDTVRRQAMLSVPSLVLRENIRNFAGVRANHSKDDFYIRESLTVPGFFLLAGIKSPGLTAAPAIAEEAVKYVHSRTPLTPKADFRDGRHVVRFKSLTDEEKSKVIESDPRYGRVICRCETITEGEIVAAIHTEIPPTSVNGVKRRVSAGMGRCQGGFCGPRVQEILSRELGIPMEEIPLDQPGSYILTGRTKEI